MKGGQPGELGENCSWPTCKFERNREKHAYISQIQPGYNQIVRKLK